MPTDHLGRHAPQPVGVQGNGGTRRKYCQQHYETNQRCDQKHDLEEDVVRREHGDAFDRGHEAGQKRWHDADGENRGRDESMAASMVTGTGAAVTGSAFGRSMANHGSLSPA